MKRGHRWEIPQATVDTIHRLQLKVYRIVDKAVQDNEAFMSAFLEARQPKTEADTPIGRMLDHTFRSGQFCDGTRYREHDVGAPLYAMQQGNLEADNQPHVTITVLR